MANNILHYLVVCCVILWDFAEGICFYNSLKREETDYGPGRRYCEYYPEGGKYSLDIMIGSRFETRDCLRCDCSDQGFRCCGIGIRERSYHIPPNCKLVARGCTPLLVLKSNPLMDCYNRRPVDLINNGFGYDTESRIRPSMEFRRRIRRLQRLQKGEHEYESPAQAAAATLMGNPLSQANPLMTLMQSFFAP